MSSRIDKYRMKDGVTVLGERFFNPVFQDVDLRITALENLNIAWEQAVNTVTQFGLIRINEVLAPSFAEADAKSAEIEAARLAAIAAMAELQDALDNYEAIASADITAWKNAHIAELGTLAGHALLTDNPHAVTKAQVGLGNVDNTSDVNKPVSTAVQAALDAKAGITTQQTLTNKTITGLLETKAAIAASNIDLSTANLFSKTIGGATTFTVSNVPAAGTAASFLLDLTNGGSAVITWWSGVKWANGTAPTLTAAGRDVLGFFTHDGGATWTGLVLGKDVK